MLPVKTRKVHPIAATLFYHTPLHGKDARHPQNQEKKSPAASDPDVHIPGSSTALAVGGCVDFLAQWRLSEKSPAASEPIKEKPSGLSVPTTIGDLPKVDKV